MGIGRGRGGRGESSLPITAVPEAECRYRSDDDLSPMVSRGCLRVRAQHGASALMTMIIIIILMTITSKRNLGNLNTELRSNYRVCSIMLQVSRRRIIRTFM